LKTDIQYPDLTKRSSNQIDELFESRKSDHLSLSLSEKNEALGGSGIDRIHLIHEAVPDIDFNQISISQTILGLKMPTPFLVSSMTAGHKDASQVNHVLAEAAAKNGWLMGVGSQRRQLFDPSAKQEWVNLRKKVPNVKMLGNLGLSQLSDISIDQVKALIDTLEAEAMIIHTNPLQEALQPEGTPHFKDSLKALSVLAKNLAVPVILKETGCGFSKDSLDRLHDLGIKAVDLGGFGGTHWGRIEGDRAKSSNDVLRAQAAVAFADWGISTVDSMLNANSKVRPYEIWASGGVRSGVDAAKYFAMGAKAVGFAKPALQASLKGVETLVAWMDQVEFELKVALFCTGCNNLVELQEKKPWTNKI
jgi:isopentenyl-diphosphate delta-isomerase